MKNNNYTYPYAINEDGKPVHIEEITKENRHDCHYHCYGCGAELFPVLGDIREHHFRHEKGSTCDPNKYLHEFAKAEIKKKFDESDSFVVKYQAHQKCKKADKCDFYKQYHWPECEREGLYAVDLKQFYDTCTSEKGYYQELPDGKKRYVADLFLSHSQKPENKQVCIEIWVTHECTEEKKQNGGRIIEIKIAKESDAFRDIVESDDENMPIRFFNFQREIPIDMNRTFKHVKIMNGLRGKVIVTDETPCSEGLQYDTKGENEIIISTTDVNIDSLELLYAAKCNKKSIFFPHLQLCEHGRIYRRQKQYDFSCQFLTRSNLQCPCKSFKYSPEKGDNVINSFKDIPYWEADSEEG